MENNYSIGPQKNSGMKPDEVYTLYKNAKRYFNSNLINIQKKYIHSHYNFKEGDIVRVKITCVKKPTLIYIDSLFFHCQTSPYDDCAYRNPVVKIYGHEVDEQGYNLISFSSNKNQMVKVEAFADDVVELTYIQPKGFRF